MFSSFSVERGSPATLTLSETNQERHFMATYISLLKFTEKGSKGIKQTMSRAAQFKKTAEKAGVTVIGQYWTMGSYDGVLVLRADHENDALRCLTDLASDGCVTTHTLPAFEAGEIKEILKG
jgi:uncharacterized protein with GYD domain